MEPEPVLDESPPGMPQWVKALAAVAVAAILVLALLAVVLGGDHGPGRHAPIELALTAWTRYQ